jgi:hypothetical protein
MRAGRSLRVQTMALSARASPDWMPDGNCGRIASRVMAAGACWADDKPGSAPAPVSAKAFDKKIRRSMRYIPEKS